MIEIIYKGEEEALNDEINIRLPKNIRQIGECEGSAGQNGGPDEGLWGPVRGEGRSDVPEQPPGPDHRH